MACYKKVATGPDRVYNASACMRSCLLKMPVQFSTYLVTNPYIYLPQPNSWQLSNNNCAESMGNGTFTGSTGAVMWSKKKKFIFRKYILFDLDSHLSPQSGPRLLPSWLLQSFIFFILVQPLPVTWRHLPSHTIGGSWDPSAGDNYPQ